MGYYSKIPLEKLKQIHYAQLKVIKYRKQHNLIEGFQIMEKNPIMAGNMLQSFLKETFDNSGPEIKGDLLGMHLYIAVLNKLPLVKVEGMEAETAREIKRKREIARQQIDAGKIDKILRQEGGIR
jgi:hypothetical protein